MSLPSADGGVDAIGEIDFGGVVALFVVVTGDLDFVGTGEGSAGLAELGAGAVGFTSAGAAAGVTTVAGLVSPVGVASGFASAGLVAAGLAVSSARAVASNATNRKASRAANANRACQHKVRRTKHIATSSDEIRDGGLQTADGKRKTLATSIVPTEWDDNHRSRPKRKPAASRVLNPAKAVKNRGLWRQNRQPRYFEAAPFDAFGSLSLVLASSLCVAHHVRHLETASVRWASLSRNKVCNWNAWGPSMRALM